MRGLYIHLTFLEDNIGNHNLLQIGTSFATRVKQVLRQNDYEKLLPIITVLSEKGEISSAESVAIIVRRVIKCIEGGVVG